MANSQIPVIIEFQAGSQVSDVPAEPVVFSGVAPSAPQLSIVTPDGRRALLPTDQVVLNEIVAARKGAPRSGLIRIGLGGMSFEGLEASQLVFWRVREVLPDGHVGPGSADKILIDPEMVTAIHVRGSRVWPTSN